MEVYVGGRGNGKTYKTIKLSMELKVEYFLSDLIRRENKR